jgi:uncharacterized protein (DUF1800 family)
MKPTRREWLASAIALSALYGCSSDELLERIGVAGKRAQLVPPNDASLDLASHVLQRCTFGVRPGDREALLALGATQVAAVDAWFAEQLAPASIEDAVCERAVRRYETLSEPIGELYEYRERILLQELTSATLHRAVHTRRQLHEVLCHFWSDHFNIDISKGECAWLKVADDREVIRRHALGSFHDLLHASALSPAMLWYLDGRVNKKQKAADKPNENYARELLELHTLGVDGGYTQQDVMEVARCLTGWTVRDRKGFFKGRVEFQAHLHDDGEKLVLGERLPAGLGAADIDRVIDIVARHPSTARHVARKLCARFIADGSPAIEAVAAEFTRSQGDIAATLTALFRQPEFRDSGVRGAKLKRPFHFMASCLRATEAETNCGPQLTEYLSRMGHAPFQHPTPDGYPEASAAWTGTLLWRWRLAAVLAHDEVPGTRIAAAALARRFDGDAALLAHLYGRAPSAEELAAIRDAGEDALALALASPAFQRC